MWSNVCLQVSLGGGGKGRSHHDPEAIAWPFSSRCTLVVLRSPTYIILSSQGLTEVPYLGRHSGCVFEILLVVQRHNALVKSHELGVCWSPQTTLTPFKGLPLSLITKST